MTVQSLFPILLTHDLARLSAFYETALGAVETYRFADAYVALALGEASLGIAVDPDAATDGDRVAVWFYVDDVDAAHDAIVSAGGGSIDAPADMPWGERVARVRDIDGNLLNLGAAAS